MYLLLSAHKLITNLNSRSDMGYYIGLEGGEGCTKTDQGNMLAEHYGRMGLNVVRVREPGGTKAGERIREVLLGGDPDDLDAYEELCLFSAARHALVRQVILPSLEQGMLVISDRTFVSSEAYQGVAGGLGLEKVGKYTDDATSGVRPDCLVLLDVEPEVGLARETDKDRISHKEIQYHKTLINAYRKIASKRGYPIVQVVDGRTHPEGVQGAKQEVFKQLTGILDSKVEEALKCGRLKNTRDC